MQKRIKTILAILILSIFSKSVNADDVIFLGKGVPSPYDGFLFTREKTLDVKNTYIERDEFKLLNESLNRSLTLYKDNEKINQEKLNVLLDQNDTLAKELYSSRGTNNWEKLAWFIGGVAVSGLAFYGATKLYNK